MKYTVILILCTFVVGCGSSGGSKKGDKPGRHEIPEKPKCGMAKIRPKDAIEVVAQVQRQFATILEGNSKLCDDNDNMALYSALITQGLMDRGYEDVLDEGYDDDSYAPFLFLTLTEDHCAFADDFQKKFPTNKICNGGER